MEENTNTTSIALTQYNKMQVERSLLTELPAVTNANFQHWINIVNLQDKQAITDLLQQFNIHPLVIEDVFNTEQRPKIDYFDEYLFMVARVQLDKRRSVQFSFILLPDTLISIQDLHYDYFKLANQRLDIADAKVRQNGCDYLFYLLLDGLVDNQMLVVETVEEKVESLEELFLKNQESLSLDAIYKLKQQVLFLRKKLLPLRDCLTSLLKSETHLIDKHTMVYLRDVYDHTVRLNESLDAQREMLVTLLEIYLSSVNNKMNQTMKVLTMFAAIFIPLSFIASLYGMNFANMPELKWHYGYYITLGVMASIGFGLLAWFKKKKWF